MTNREFTVATHDQVEGFLLIETNGQPFILVVKPKQCQNVKDTNVDKRGAVCGNLTANYSMSSTFSLLINSFGMDKKNVDLPAIALNAAWVLRDSGPSGNLTNRPKSWASARQTR